MSEDDADLELTVCSASLMTSGVDMSKDDAGFKLSVCSASLVTTGGDMSKDDADLSTCEISINLSFCTTRLGTTSVVALGDDARLELAVGTT